MKNKLALLKEIEIFSTLDNKGLEVVADNSELITYSEGTVIFEKNTASRNFFIVQSGEVRISNQLDNKDEKAIACFIAGEIFGEFDLFEDDMRTAYAIANEDSTLLVFPKQGDQFSEIYKKHPDTFAKIYHSLITLNAHSIRNANKLVSKKTEWIHYGTTKSSRLL